MLDGNNKVKGTSSKKVKQENTLLNMEWLINAIPSVVGTDKKPTKRQISELLKVTKSEELGGIKAAITRLVHIVNLKPLRWRDNLEALDLPAVSLSKDNYLSIVKTRTKSHWVVEDSSGQQLKSELGEDQNFLSLHQITKEKSEISAVGLFRHIFFSDKKWLFYNWLGSLISSTLVLATSLYTMQVYDRVISTGGLDTLKVLTIGVGIAIVFDFLTKLAKSSIVNHANKNIDIKAAAGVFERLLNVRYDKFPTSVGTFAAQIKGFETVRAFFSSALNFLIAELPFAIFFVFVILLIAGPLMAIVPAIAFCVSLSVGLCLKFAIKRHSRQETLVGNRRHGLLVETISSFETLKSYGAEWKSMGKWNSLSFDTSNESHQIKVLNDLSGFFAGLIQQISYVALVALGAALATTGSELTIGSIIACSIISGRVLTPINMLPGLLSQWGHAKISLENLEKLFSLESDTDGISKELYPEKISGSYSLSKVEFVWPGRITPISIEKLDIKSGEKVAIVGGVGSGKSTLLKLLAGLCVPERGNVLLDSINLNHIAAEKRSENIGYLSQHSKLLSGSLRENLSLGGAYYSDQEIIDTLKELGLNELVNTNPEGVDLKLPEGGEGLSGGQRQLVSIARLLLSHPEIWLLDEPTSSLDEYTEAKVLDVLKLKVTKKQTLVVVTHRPRALQLVDRIIVLGPSGIVMDGPKKDILSKLNQNVSTVKNSNKSYYSKESVSSKYVIKDKKNRVSKQEEGS